MTPAPDPSSIFRAEALAHRAESPATDVVLAPAPRWIRGAYWAVLLGFGALVVATVAVRIPRDVRVAATVRADGDGVLRAWASVPEGDVRAARRGASAWLEADGARVPLVLDGVDGVHGACATPGLRIVRAHGALVRGGRVPRDRDATLVIRAGTPRLIAVLVPPLARVLDGHGDGS